MHDISSNLLVLRDINTLVFIFCEPDRVIISDWNYFWLVSIMSNTKLSKSILQVLLLVNKQLTGLFITSDPYT
jgi:hypothetical protein